LDSSVTTEGEAVAGASEEEGGTTFL
jgi:hypothetical protein